MNSKSKTTNLNSTSLENQSLHNTGMYNTNLCGQWKCYIIKWFFFLVLWFSLSLGWCYVFGGWLGWQCFFRSVQYQQNLFFGLKVQVEIFVFLILILPFICMKKLLSPWTLTKSENQMEMWKMVATLIHHVIMNFLPFQFLYIMV